MSIASEIQRIQEAKQGLKLALEAKGLTIGNDELINNYASYINVLGDKVGPLTFETIPDDSGYYDSFSVSWEKGGGIEDKVIEYRIFDGRGNMVNDWTELYPGNSSASVPSADPYDARTAPKIEFRGNNTTYGDEYSYHSLRPSHTYYGCKCYGNLNSLLNDSLGAIPDYCFQSLFDSCSSLKDCEGLILPSDNVGVGAYKHMFRYCSDLVTAPKILPATELNDYCYHGMFDSCQNLTTPPRLPATTLADFCYYEMFQSCYELQSAPELPATTLSDSCYMYMFASCSNLNYVKCLALDTGLIYLAGWLSSVASSGTFVKNPQATTWEEGGDGIPYGWTVQDAS